MTIATGQTVAAADVLAIQTIANSASAAAASAYANAASALTNAGSAVATANAAMSAAGVALSISGLPAATTVLGSDFVPISHSGTNYAITLGNLLGPPLTVDLLPPAAAASDSDVLITGQGSNAMAAQTLSALWVWAQSHLSGWKKTVVPISTNTQLDGSVHNNAVLVVSSPVTINAAFNTQGSGFTCTILNASAGTVTLGSGFTTNTGSMTIAPQQSATITAASYSGGNLNYANISLAGVVLAIPGQVTGLTVGTITSNTVALSWTAPATGGTPAFYQVQWRVTGSSPWTYSATASGTSYIATGLTAGTGYDFQAAAVNNGGTGTFSAAASATTAPAATYAPNVPASLTAGTPTSTAIPVSWTAPATDGTHGAATSFTVQWRVTGNTGWTQQSGISGTSYTISGLTASTGYDLQVQAVNAVGPSAFTGTTNATTAAAPGYAPAVPTSLTIGTVTATTIPVSWTAPATDGTHGAAATYTLNYRVTGNSTWTQITGISGTSQTITGLSASTSYDTEVQAMNGTGSSAFTSIVTGTTAPASNYQLSSGFQPTTLTFAHNATSIQMNVNDDSGAGWGGKTSPAHVYFGWTNSPTVGPSSTAGLQLAQGTFGNSGTTFWYTYSGVAPSSAGTWYLWAVAVDGTGTIVASCAYANGISNSTPVAFTIT